MAIKKGFFSLLKMFKKEQMVLHSSEEHFEKVFQAEDLSEQPSSGTRGVFRCVFSDDIIDVGKKFQLELDELEDYNLENIKKRKFGQVGRKFVAAPSSNQKYRITAENNSYVGEIHKHLTDGQIKIKTVNAVKHGTTQVWAVEIKHFLPTLFDIPIDLTSATVEAKYMHVRKTVDETLLAGGIYPVTLISSWGRGAIVYKDKNYQSKDLIDNGDIKLCRR